MQDGNFSWRPSGVNGPPGTAPRKWSRNGFFKQAEKRKPEWYPKWAEAEVTVVKMEEKLGRFNYDENVVTEAV